MESIVVRDAEVKDAAQIAKVHVETWQSAYKGQIPDSFLDQLSIEKRTEGWKEQLENPQEGVHSFVVEDNGEVVGWCTSGISRDEDSDAETGEWYGIYVLPGHDGKGFGSAMINKALDRLKEDGYKKATLWVLDTNEKTRRWYEAKGWKVEGKTKVDKRDDIELHEIRYIIDL